MALQTDTPLAIASAAPQQGGYQVLQVPYYPNDETEWCWAACSQMMGSLFLNKLIDQCTFAAAAFPTANCCQNRDACNVTLPTADMGQVFAVINKVPNYVPTCISFAELQEQIGEKQLPVQVGFQWNDGGGHVAVVCGVSDQGTDQQVYVNDPVYGCGWIEFSNLQGAYGLGAWQWTWKMDG
jgi:hypothetical protein